MNKWKENETVEIILNLNLFIVTYVKVCDINDETQKIVQLKQEKLKQGETYFFALCIDCDNRCCVFECVSPTIQNNYKHYLEADQI